MHIFITGGTGLIGRLLVKKLLTEGHTLVLLCRNKQKANRQFADTVSYCTNINAISSFDDFNAVINLAGEPLAEKRWTTKQKQWLCDSRWNLTHHLSQLIISSASPPEVFISGSAMGYYGNQQDVVVTEQTEARNGFTNMLCDKWEQLALLAESTKTRVCLLRTAVVLAKEGGALPKMLPAFKYGFGGVIAGGKQYMPWIHISDMVNGICFLLKNSNLSGPFNMTTPNPVTNANFSKTLAKVIHRPCLFPVPAVILKILIGESATIIIEGQRAYPKRLLQAGFKFTYNTVEEALKNILTLK